MLEQFLECNMTSSIGSFKTNSLEMMQFPNQPLKNFNRAFDKISLLFQTVLELEAKSLIPSVQLDFSWTLKMSDRQNDWFARPSNSLKNSVSTICIS